MDEEVVEEVTDDPVASTLSYDPVRIAEQVVAGHWGRGNRRKERLRAAGYDPDLVLPEVYSILHR